MSTDLLDLYARASDWSKEKVAGATNLDAPTGCDEWNVRELLNHMLETQRHFAGSARGEDVSPPDPCSSAPAAKKASSTRQDRRWASRSATSCCTAGTWPAPPDRTRRCRTV